MNDQINRAILQLHKRAEKYTDEELVETFVDVGPLFTLLQNSDHQILYGRRGTGKTHVLSYLKRIQTNKGDCSVYLDLRTIGSTGGLYSDTSIPLAERATRLLVDVLSSIHDQILDFTLLNDENIDLSKIGPPLESLADAFTEVKIEGPIETEETTTTSGTEKSGLTIGVSQTGVLANMNSQDEQTKGKTQRKATSGLEKHRIHFPAIQHHFKSVIENLNGKKLWIIADEWAEIPLDLQPFLGDLLRRSLFPLFGASVKIGAIEHRSNFKISKEGSEYIGIEIGADVSSVNMDEYMVFDNDDNLATEFFERLIFKHINPHLPEAIKFNSSSQLLNAAFTQKGAFTEFVRATEGVPRDAINILSQAALKARNEKISLVNLRAAARVWYTRDKEKSVSSKENALTLLRWIIDEVLGNRNARAFLLQTDVKNSLIDFLYDSRVIHLIKQSIAGQDKPGIRYNVYSIDYGCYVDLINTNRAPKGLFQAETDEGIEFIQVPMNDYRAIRRAILDLEEFKKSTKTQQLI
ncbi:ORC-CDC6 family AAA ATPase [Croceimicrobium hydrocarbonivorans]|uniref:Uncharacterized protein n=1 Tax=Croceimicrobium hydrocarbonivorans TaxID=2761580 RepID=A0A7H0VDN3_9FLAO|nr:hypothetical protein [Croceimicrobium hydrocarbonivorans]QNR23831.1 hypothetical protein H4K34_15855 [Croceimicrobium hydrocarbonivorans]